MSSRTVETAKELLAALPEGPWHFEPVSHSTTGAPSDTRGALQNSADNVISPVPESRSMLTAKPGVLAAFAQIPEVLQDLIDELEYLSK